MRAASFLVLCAMTLAWCSPAVLARLTASGVSTRLGLTAWLMALASVLVCLAVALQKLIGAAASGWHLLAEAFCRSVAGHACASPVYRGAIFEVPLAAGALAAGITSAILAWRYGRYVQRSQQRTRAHAEAAHIAGRQIPGSSGTLVLEVAEPAAYCVPGRPAAIVLTTGALAVLDDAQLTAVLQHENAHLAGRHHAIIGLTRALAATFPGVPLFSRARSEVSRLAEMHADDAAARRSGRAVLVTALLAMSTGAAVPVFALAATGCEVSARVSRLLHPASRTQRIGNRLALLAIMIFCAAGVAVLTHFADPSALPGLSLPV